MSITSPSRAPTLPAVIRLLRYIRRSYRNRVQQENFRRDNYTCHYSGGWVNPDDRSSSPFIGVGDLLGQRGGASSSSAQGNRRMRCICSASEATTLRCLSQSSPALSNKPFKIWQHWPTSDRDSPAGRAHCTGRSGFRALQANHGTCGFLCLLAGLLLVLFHGIWHGWHGSFVPR
jgi:hypothetical protein